MVKLAQKGPQDPVDSSLQMKVSLFVTLRLDNTSLWAENYPLNRIPTPKSMPSDSSPETKSSPNLNSGTISDVNSRPRVPKVKFCQSTRSSNADPITSKPSALF